MVHTQMYTSYVGSRITAKIHARRYENDSVKKVEEVEEVDLDTLILNSQKLSTEIQEVEEVDIDTLINISNKIHYVI